MKLSTTTITRVNRGPFPTVTRIQPQQELYTQPVAFIKDFRVLSKQKQDLPLDELTFAALDCEFLPCKNRRVIGEIAVVRFNVHGLIDCFHTVIKHEDVGELAFASAKSKEKYRKMSADAPTIRKVREHVKELINGCIWVGHGVGPNLIAVDFSLLYPGLTGKEIKLRQKYSLETSSLSYLSLVKFSETHPPTLGALSEALKVKHLNAHAAIADAEATALCTMVLLKRFLNGYIDHQSPLKTFDKLTEALAVRKTTKQLQQAKFREAAKIAKIASKKLARKTPRKNYEYPKGAGASTARTSSSKQKRLSLRRNQDTPKGRHNASPRKKIIKQAPQVKAVKPATKLEKQLKRKLSPTKAALSFVQQHHTDAMVAFLGGSSLGKDATIKSDLDLVVFAKERHGFHATHLFAKWPIEVAAINNNNPQEAFERARQNRNPSILRICAQGEILVSQNQRAQEIRKLAQKYLSQGPVPYSRKEKNKLRFQLTSLIDDLEGCEDADESIFIANQLSVVLGTVILQSYNSWQAQGKWMLREMKNVNEKTAKEFVRVLKTVQTNKNPLLKFSSKILGANGGKLWDGYHEAK